jgi:hypothetical protein
LIIEYFDLIGLNVTFEALAVWMLHLFVLRVSPLHLTSACDAQQSNQITSLDGAVFPAGLTLLVLVSFDYRIFWFEGR